MRFYPNAQVVREFNTCHDPNSGKFCSDLPMKILKGVDPKANLARMESEAAENAEVRGSAPLTREEQHLVRETLRAMPFVHGTNVTAAVAAMQEGLHSLRDLEPRKAQLKADITDLKNRIVAELRRGEDVFAKSVTPKNLQVLVSDYADAPSLAAGFGIDDDSATRVYEQLTELAELEKLIEGTTFPADKRVDLDQFVFMTHGQLHDDYGPLGVVIDNKVLDNRGFSTPSDIVKYSSQGNYDYDAKGMSAYRSNIIRGRDYFKAAATSGLKAKAMPFRSRDQLWEIKVPRVPKEAVLGFVVHDLDVAQRLRDTLGVEGKVLYVDLDSRQARRWAHRQMKHIQRTGRWNEDWAERWNERTGGGSIYVL